MIRKYKQRDNNGNIKVVEHASSSASIPEPDDAMFGVRIGDAVTLTEQQKESVLLSILMRLDIEVEFAPIAELCLDHDGKLNINMPMSQTVRSLIVYYGNTGFTTLGKLRELKRTLL